MCLSSTVLRGGSRLWRRHRRPLTVHGYGVRQQSDSSAFKMSHILKSPFDKKEYREITLSNGLTALLVSDIDLSGMGTQHRPFPVKNQHNSKYHGAKDRSSTSSDTDNTTDTNTDEDNSAMPSEDEYECHVSKVPGLLSARARARDYKEEKKMKHQKKAKIRCKKCGAKFTPPTSPARDEELMSDIGTTETDETDQEMVETEVEGEDDTDDEKMTIEVVMSAAALCIGVGSFCDPEDIPGFAHFLEHMVFMGSKKYKKENAFDDFISKYGGESNAWTDAERTTFYFDIHKNQFHKALDIFAQFFISPLFLKGSVDREISAVDHEFQGIKANDNDRYHQLLGSLAFNGNPMTHFLCGNSRTLKTIPQEKGLDVYGRLRDFYQRMYSAHYMTLVVQAPEPLDDLEELVVDLFEDIPNNRLSVPQMLEHRDPFVPRNFHKLFKVIPTEDCQRLDICWALPTLQKRFKVKPLEYLGVLITHEGPGSILSLLRKKNWALSLHGGNMGSGFDFNRLWSGFQLTIMLTDLGMEHVPDVISMVFEYVQMLQKCGPQAWFYAELRDIENIKFRFRDELDPIENVEQVAENMQLYPLEHYLTGRTLILAYDAQLIRECLAYLTPTQSNITLWSKAFERQNICDKICPWFNTHYALEELQDSWKELWAFPKANPDLFLPEKNYFIPTEFSLVKVPEAPDYPVQVLDNEFGRFWHKKDKKFKMPKGFMLLHLMTPVVSTSVESATLCDLFIAILQQQLVENLYAATLTGYEFALEGVSTGIVIHVSGFSDKLAHVLKLVVNHMSSLNFTEDLFENVRAHLRKSYYNEMLKAYDFAKMLRFATTEPHNPPLPDRYRVVDNLRPDMLQQFHNHLMDALYIEGLVTGNFTPQHARAVGEFVQKQLCRQPLPCDSIPVRRLLQLPQGDLQCRLNSVNRRDTSSCVNSYYQQGPGTIRDTCLNELLTMRMKEPVFNKLRTEKQLGYSVFCQHMVSNGILGFSITIETHANKFKMTDVQLAITQFMQAFQKTLNRMTKPQFNDLVKAAITAKQVEDTQLADETNRCWQEIMDKYYVFDRQEREIELLASISHAELKAWYQKILSPTHRHVSFQVEGCTQDCMDTGTPVAPPAEVGETEKDYFKLVTDGKGFVEDLERFRAGLTMYPYAQVTQTE